VTGPPSHNAPLAPRPVTVDAGIAPPAAAATPCVPVSWHTAPQGYVPWPGHPLGLVLGTVAPSPLPGHPDLAPWRAHGLCSATDPAHVPTTVPTSASPRASPAAFAAWGLLPPGRLRLTPAHQCGSIQAGFVHPAQGGADT
jgi:hypothetical protein